MLTQNFKLYKKSINLNRVKTKFLSLYIHIPFCTTRCSYCSFNVYTLGNFGSTNFDIWLSALSVELSLVTKKFKFLVIKTIFIGGGTPSLLGGLGLGAILGIIRSNFKFSSKIEITTEANPESTSPTIFAQLLKLGFTRISIGMQSLAPKVLSALNRIHFPSRAFIAVTEAKNIGFKHVNLDLIYGAPEETNYDLKQSIKSAINSGIDHLSAYVLNIEKGTILSRKLQNNTEKILNENIIAFKRNLIDKQLSNAGFYWYEISNWSLPGGECKHNISYLNDGEWCGVGPGSHSFVNGIRWWGIKNLDIYVLELISGNLPIVNYEKLNNISIHIEMIMLRIKLRYGLPCNLLNSKELNKAIILYKKKFLYSNFRNFMLTSRGHSLTDLVIEKILN